MSCFFTCSPVLKCYYQKNVYRHNGWKCIVWKHQYLLHKGEKEESRQAGVENVWPTVWHAKSAQRHGCAIRDAPNCQPNVKKKRFVQQKNATSWFNKKISWLAWNNQWLLLDLRFKSSVVTRMVSNWLIILFWVALCQPIRHICQQLH